MNLLLDDPPVPDTWEKAQSRYNEAVRSEERMRRIEEINYRPYAPPINWEILKKAYSDFYEEGMSLDEFGEEVAYRWMLKGAGRFSVYTSKMALQAASEEATQDEVNSSLVAKEA